MQPERARDCGSTAGLLILPNNADVGAPINTVFPSDTILDVEITPNRGDLLSHFGLAREISALTGQPYRLPLSIAAHPSPAAQDVGIQINALKEFRFTRRAESKISHRTKLPTGFAPESKRSEFVPLTTSLISQIS